MTAGDGATRPKISDMLKAALSPRLPIEVDPDAPNPIPKSVRWAGGLIIASGVINLVFGLIGAFLRHQIVDVAVQRANDQIASCNSAGIGIGSAVTSTDTSQQVQTCKVLGPITQDAINAALTSALVVGLVVAVIGGASILAGLGVFRGAVWARRLATPIAIVLLIATVLNVLAALPQFVATLLLVIALSLLYVGKGANYYIRAKAKGVR